VAAPWPVRAATTPRKNARPTHRRVPERVGHGERRVPPLERDVRQPCPVPVAAVTPVGRRALERRTRSSKARRRAAGCPCRPSWPAPSIPTCGTLTSVPMGRDVSCSTIRSAAAVSPRAAAAISGVSYAPVLPGNSRAIRSPSARSSVKRPSMCSTLPTLRYVSASCSRPAGIPHARPEAAQRLVGAVQVHGRVGRPSRGRRWRRAPARPCAAPTRTRSSSRRGTARSCGRAPRARTPRAGRGARTSARGSRRGRSGRVVVGARQPDGGEGEGGVEAVGRAVGLDRPCPLRLVGERLARGELAEGGVGRRLRGGRRDRVVELAVQHERERPDDALLEPRDRPGAVGRGRGLGPDAPPHLAARHVHEVGARLDAVARAEQRAGDEVARAERARPDERLGSRRGLHPAQHRRDARLGQPPRDLVLRQQRELAERGVARAVLERRDGDAGRGRVRRRRGRAATVAATRGVSGLADVRPRATTAAATATSASIPAPASSTRRRVPRPAAAAALPTDAGAVVRCSPERVTPSSASTSARADPGARRAPWRGSASRRRRAPPAPAAPQSPATAAPRRCAPP
jgi:hypothetical protein